MRAHWEVGDGQESCLSVWKRLRDKGRMKQEEGHLDIML